MSVLKFAAAFLALPAALAAPSAAAQAYPARPVTWIVPFVAGGATDVLARHIADRVGKALGQPVVIDNSPGAGGTVGAARAAKATPDGYTLLVGHMGYMGAAPALYRKLAYDPAKDFEAVFRFPDTPLVVMVRPGHPARDVAGLIDYARANPGKLNIGNAGVGSSSHLIAALVAATAGVQFTLVPYKGAGPALLDVVGGQTDGMFDQTNTALPQIREKKVRALAVTSKVRLPQLKDVPTLHETVMPGFEASTWYGIYAPRGTPMAIRDQIESAYLKVMRDGSYTAKMVEQAIQMLPEAEYRGAALAKLTESEILRWRATAARANLSLD